MTVKTCKPENEAKQTEAQKLEGVVIGLLSGIDEKNNPLIIFPGNSDENPIAAKSLAVCSTADIGRQVALLFEDGNPEKPLVVGLIQNPIPPPSDYTEPQVEKYVETGEDLENTSLELDGEVINLKAKEEITLKCGKASITLTKAGKILLRGTYVLNRSSGVNRIKGGSVQIN